MTRFKYDYMDVRICSALDKFTPRRIHQISVHLGIPESTLRHRIHRLIDLELLKLSINPRYNYLGLISAIVRIDYNPKYIEHLYSSLGENPYLLCLQKIYSSKPALFMFYSIPIESKKHLLRYLDKIVKMGFATNYSIDWLMDFHRNNFNIKWFDEKMMRWIFNWKHLHNYFKKCLKDFDEDKIYTHFEEKVYNKIRDNYDIQLLEAMEESGDLSLSELSNKLNTTVQNLHYHFHRHVIQGNLVESYIIVFEKFLKDTVLYPVFHIVFEKNKYMKIFSDILKGSPIVEFIGYGIGDNKMIQIGIIPMNIFGDYINLLDRMVSEGYVKDYSHYFMEKNFIECKRKLPYSYYNKIGWNYDYEAYIDKLNKF